ncbi:MAG: hypothetical protein AB8G14_13090 [Ilumatobacter sp.]
MNGVEQLRQAAVERRAEVSHRLDTSPTAMQTSLDKVLVRAAVSGTTGAGAATGVPQPSTTPPGGAAGTGAGPWVAGVGLLLGGGLLVAAVATSSSNSPDTSIAAAAAAAASGVTATEVAASPVVPSTPLPTSDPVLTAAVSEVPVTAAPAPTTVATPAEELDTQDTTTVPVLVLTPDESAPNDASTTGGAETGGGTTGAATTGGPDTAGTDTGSDSGGATETGTDTGTAADSGSTAGLGSGTEDGVGSGTDTGSTTGGDATDGDATGGDATGGDDPPPPPPPPASTCGGTAGLPAGAVAVVVGAGDFDGDGDSDIVGLYNTASGVAVVVDRSNAGLSDVGFVGEKPLSDLSSTASVRSVRTEGTELGFGIIIDDLDDDGSTAWLRPFAVGECAVTALELPGEPGEPGGDVWGGSGYTFEGSDFGLQCLTEGDETIVTFLSDSDVGALVAFDPAGPSLVFIDDAAAENEGCWQ